jgi:REP element-mobilizing transposase RayT
LSFKLILLYTYDGYVTRKRQNDLFTRLSIEYVGAYCIRTVKTFQIRKNIQLDEYVIMPNHFHGIIVLTENTGHNELCPYRRK